MERLTYKAKSNCGYVWALRTPGTGMQMAIDRLAAYEETGLEPEEIHDQLESMVDAVALFFEISPNRLRELAQADREGRCVVLPVKPGTPVWSTAFCRVDEDGTEHPTPWPFGPWMVDGWGRDWFPTCEEAEAALRREQDG